MTIDSKFNPEYFKDQPLCYMDFDFQKIATQLAKEVSSIQESFFRSIIYEYLHLVVEDSEIIKHASFRIQEGIEGKYLLWDGKPLAFWNLLPAQYEDGKLILKAQTKKLF